MTAMLGCEGPIEDSALHEAAARLAAAAATREACEPITNLIAPGNIDAAYAIQNILTDRALASGRRIVGRKIGLTAKAVQAQLGVDQPDFGILFADMVVGENLPIPKNRLMQPRIEAEIALILRCSLDLADPTVADVVRATEFVFPALEIVGSRIRNWEISIADTIADNASSGLVVLGGPARRINDINMRTAAMTMRRNGEVVSVGSGEACLGHPLNAAAWLAGEMVRRGRPLLEGDLILTGALGPMVPVAAGDRFDAEITGIGQVSAVFE